ncbi:phage minor head protein [Micromonospora chersina]|uniref:phage minor head protein n=1 Tax=Micromonospora chersina TaxID=47854 RepID=UPI0037192D5F
MAISRETLRQLRQLATTVGGHADDATRKLTEAWVRAWDELAPAWQAAIADLIAKAAADGQWPSPWQLARVERLAAAVVATSTALDQLAAQANATAGAGASAIVAATAAAEPALIASQLPAAMAATAAAEYAAKLTPTALDVIVRRSREQITARNRPLSAAAIESVRRSLIKGVAVGDNPRTVARDMLARVEGDFNGGLTRALVVARTELLDAYRTTSRYAHTANADVLDGWIWHSSLDTRTCQSCWAMHGTVHPLNEEGPLDHQQGRCTRLPKVKPWRDLGVDLDEPADLTPDARARFDGLPEEQQLAILGAGRLALLNAGRIQWSDLATRRDTPGWRSSYAPTSLRDLRRIADRATT